MTSWDAERDGLLARDFIAESHRGLPMLRVLLPLIDPAGRLVRWSEFVSPSDELASLDWWDVVDRVAEGRSEIRDLTSCRGVLDVSTVAALGDVIGDDDLTCLRWTGYADAPRDNATIRVRGEEYFVSSLRRGDLKADDRIPEFVWGVEGTIAWGARLYPDSLVVTGELTRMRRLHADPRVDTIVVRPDVDVLPPSSGD